MKVRRVWARVPDPHRPGRQVVGFVGRRGEWDPEQDMWELLTNEEVEPMRKTRYEALLERAAELRAQRVALAREAEEARRQAAEALAQGRPARAPRRDYESELRLLDAAIVQAETEAHSPEVVAAHVAEKLQAIQAERERLARERRPAEEAVQRAKQALKEAEQHLAELQVRHRDRLDALLREEMALRAMVEQGEPAREVPTGVDEAQVDELLAGLRAGQIRSVMAGQDPALDAAVARYEAERAELRQWASRVKAAARSGADRPAPPACASHYTRERLREITGLRDLAGLSGVTTVVREEVTA